MSDVTTPVSTIDTDALEGLSEAPKSFGRLAWERFIHHRLALVGLFGLLLIVAAFILGPIINQHPFDKPNVLNRLQGPSREHWFGTDEIGRDLFVRTARGGRYSILIGLVAALASTAVGTIVGATAGYFGKAFDAVVAQVINLVLVVPGLIVLSVFALNFEIGRAHV